MPPTLRRTARLLVLDPEKHVLLLQYADGDRTWWATPGGALDGDETFEEAAAREAAEELAVSCTVFAPLWRQTVEFAVRDTTIRQVEQYFLLRVSRDEVVLGDNVREAHIREGILSTRWWSLQEMDATSELIFPEELADRVRGLPAC